MLYTKMVRLTGRLPSKLIEPIMLLIRKLGETYGSIEELVENRSLVNTTKGQFLGWQQKIAQLLARFVLNYKPNP